ncbi:hypothetical protein Sango_2329100 [Sesamum angolense]|uniref:Integrase catalytic domain-containing protein n=1 Tax=Sesamum angolense TaxID=2727404 RepID=A0AAE1WAT0_9LAMI|nr:hypothetical protein Sango_2329100 [Sesamum angolense]
MDVLRKMKIGVASLRPVNTPLVGFGGSEVIPLGTIDLPVSIGMEPQRKTMMVKFLVVDTPLSKFGTMCLGPEKANYMLREIHEGSCENHSGGRSLAQKVTRQGYFWPTLVKDAMEFTKKFENCQRFGIPRILISDNGTQFQGKKIMEWCKGLKIKQNFTTVGNPQANEQMKVSNRILLQHLKTRLDGAEGSWVEELLGVLWAYRTTPRTSIGETPFCLVYGSKAIIPAEIGEETARIAQYSVEENEQARKFDLVTVEETRDSAYAKILHYKGLMTKS